MVFQDILYCKAKGCEVWSRKKVVHLYHFTFSLNVTGTSYYHGNWGLSVLNPWSSRRLYGFFWRAGEIIHRQACSHQTGAKILPFFFKLCVHFSLKLNLDTNWAICPIDTKILTSISLKENVLCLNYGDAIEIHDRVRRG